jgi:hypothetical protein
MDIDRTEIYKAISEMLDNPDKYGIYPTTDCFDRLERYCEKVRAEAVGWAYAYACTMVDNEIDIRETEAPKILEEAIKNLSA